jgi:hypothetical protein
MDPILPVGIAIIAVGISLSAGYARDLYFGWQSRHWPRTQGRVIERGMDVGAKVSYADNSALVGYEYEVGGVRYTSRRIDYAGRGAGFDVNRILGRYSEGERVGVSYDPGNPARALLEPGIALGNVLRLGCGLAIIAFGLLFLPLAS